ncbi:MAG: TIGR02301 family protein [Methylocystaceae bacterium]|nr:MAG: TIGR02301 family protein [Methylocystaceae bacterium]
MKRLSFGLCVIACATLCAAGPAPAQDFFSDLFGGGWPAARRAPPPAVERRVQKPKPKKKPAAKPPQQAAPPAPGAASPGAVVDGPPPPYEPQLLRLSEILGALAFLRDLCGAKDGDDWRAKMASLLEAEAKTAARRQKLAGAFNRGFRGYETTYRACTPNAESAISRYLEEGGRIAHDITYRYGNS